MNADVLIDSVVRQTTVLIAQLGTSAGVRTSLTHVANQVFLDLVRELRQQGLSNKVIADMFGLALRTYHAKVQRLTESGTEGGRSLWEALATRPAIELPPRKPGRPRAFGCGEIAPVVAKGTATGASRDTK